MSAQTTKKGTRKTTVSAAPYPNAPIKEAIIDIRVTLPEATTLAYLTHGFNSSFLEAYPSRSDLFLFKGHFSAGTQVAATASQTQGGYRFISKDKIHIVQWRLDGFTFSRLAPYDRWDSFQLEARRLWDLYRSSLLPTEITRVAVRYINQINIPHASIEWKDYFRTGPEISPNLEQRVEACFVQIQIPQDDLKAKLSITQTLVPPSTPETVSVLLDIDLFRTEALPSTEEDMWTLLGKFRTRKNQAFEACLTKETRKLFY
jgi:uncharacterized protein (TIGR04255 family)